KADVARARPGNDVAGLVRNGHDGIVERRADMGYAARDILALPPARPSPASPRPSQPESPLPRRAPLTLPLGTYGPSRTLTGAGIGARALPPHGQAAPVPQTAVASNIHQPFDILLNLTPQVALDGIVPFDNFPQA